MLKSGEEIILTKEQALQYHRDMWLWISKRIAESKEVQPIILLKDEYCEEHDLYPMKWCFCCEYAVQASMSKGNCKYYYDCSYCPVIWDNASLRCFGGMTEYTIISNMYYDKGNPWKRQAKLAYKIAMLPEREGV